MRQLHTTTLEALEPARVEVEVTCKRPKGYNYRGYFHLALGESIVAHVSEWEFEQLKGTEGIVVKRLRGYEDKQLAAAKAETK